MQHRCRDRPRIATTNVCERCGHASPSYCAFLLRSLDPKERRWHLNLGRFEGNTGASSAGRKSRHRLRRNAQPPNPVSRKRLRPDSGLGRKAAHGLSPRVRGRPARLPRRVTGLCANANRKDPRPNEFRRSAVRRIVECHAAGGGNGRFAASKSQPPCPADAPSDISASQSFNPPRL